jgi:prepilin signal peptidase PulO-like enzyme (type II secretory pathway)
LAAVIGLFKPESTMLILGIFLLYITLPIYIKSIKNNDFSDVINLIISGTGILFAVFCIFNSKAALHTIIIIIGIAFTILGCISLYQALTSKKDNISNDDTEDNLFTIEDNTSS